MGRDKFGWDLPPGVRHCDIDPPDPPCEVCGLSADDCVCPECPVCQTVGDPECYKKHGLTMTWEQKYHAKEADRQQCLDDMNALAMEMDALEQRIEMMFNEFCPEYPRDHELNSWEMLYAIESSFKGTLLGVEDWMKVSQKMQERGFFTQEQLLAVYEEIKE